MTADGGRIIFHRVANGLIVTLFASPSPLRPGTADFSVFVQDAATSQVISDASVKLTLITPGTKPVISQLNHNGSTNKLLYGCQPTIAMPGRYQVLLETKTPAKASVLTGDVTVLPPAPELQTYWPYIAPVPLAIGLFAANRLLRRANRASA